NHATVAVVAIEAASAVFINLSGTATGKYRSGKTAGSPVTFSGKGTVTPLGHVTLNGSLQHSTTSGDLTLSTKHGKVFVELTSLVFPPFFTYTVTGGTRRLAGATGIGTVSTDVGAFADNGQSHGRFVITFHSAVV